MESAKEVTITYETLFEILKRERDMADLQKIDANFFNNFIEYLNDKKGMMDKNDPLFSYDEKKKIERQIDNAKRMMKDIYERREKKIINIALIKSRTRSNVIDTSSLLESEKNFLNEVETVLNRHRDTILQNVMEGKNIEIREIPNKDSMPKNPGEVPSDRRGQEKKETKLVRFVCSVPKFVGEELEEYGPFSEEDIANLPMEIADLLISKGRVEEIDSN